MIIFTITACKKEEIKISFEQINSGTFHRLNKIFWVDNEIGFIVGGDRFTASTILKTSDAGQSYQAFEFPASGKSNYGICQKPDQTIIVVGFDSKWLSTTDTGISWTVKQLHHYRPLKDVGYFTSQQGLLIDGISMRSGCIYQIDEEGNTLHRDSFDFELNDLLITNSTTAFVAGMGVVLKTENRGTNWQFLPIKNDNFTAITAVGNTLWVCGIEGSIFVSPDAGQQWLMQRNGNKLLQKKYHFTDIYFINSLQGYVCGENGVLLKTQDGGRSWQLVESFTTSHLRQVESTPDNRFLIVCGDDGNIFRFALP